MKQRFLSIFSGVIVNRSISSADNFTSESSGNDSKNAG